MYYQNNDDYMRDFFYFNQNPTMNGNMGCNCMQNNMNNGMNNNFNGINNMNYMQNNNNNLESLYPNIYRIIQPVVRRVVAGSNYQYLTEEVLNNMVDTVYNIVDGDRTMNNNQVSTTRTETNTTTNTTTDTRRTVSTNANVSNTSQNVPVQTRTNEINNISNCNALLKDLIKILILQEIARNNMRRNWNGMNMNSNMMQNQYQPNCFGSMGCM